MICENINCKEIRLDFYKKEQNYKDFIMKLHNKIFWLEKPEMIRKEEERIDRKIIQLIKEDNRNKNNKYIVHYNNIDENKNE
jgi:hypothetical protein